MGAKDWLMADMGYPLRPFMVSGYRKNEMGTFAEGKTYFNVLFSGTRNIVERVYVWRAGPPLKIPACALTRPHKHAPYPNPSRRPNPNHSFGILKARFPVLHGLWYRVKNESLYHDTIRALSILHNLCVDARDEWDEDKVRQAQEKNQRLRKREERKFRTLVRAGVLRFVVHNGSLQAGRRRRHALSILRGAAVGPLPGGLPGAESDASE